MEQSEAKYRSAAVEDPWRRAANIAIVVLVGGGAAFVFFRWIAGGILPFLAAFALAACIRPAAVWMHRHSKGSIRFCSVVAAAAVLCGVGGLLVWGVGRLLAQTGAFLQQGMETVGQAQSWRDLLPERITHWLDNWIGVGGEGIAHGMFGGLFSGEMAEKLADGLWLGVQEGVGTLTGWLTGVAGRFMGLLPGLFLGCFIAVVAVFYLAADTGRGKIREDFLRLLPDRLHPAANAAAAWGKRILATAGQYLRAYAVLGSVTFLVLFSGFSVIGVRYGMVWAFVTALADLLPFIGCGCVLLPWAIWCFLTEQIWRGAGLCILLRSTGCCGNF